MPGRAGGLWSASLPLVEDQHAVDYLDTIQKQQFGKRLTNLGKCARGGGLRELSPEKRFWMLSASSSLDQLARCLQEPVLKL